jgi:hypothetical protein
VDCHLDPEHLVEHKESLLDAFHPLSFFVKQIHLDFNGTEIIPTLTHLNSF